MKHKHILQALILGALAFSLFVPGQPGVYAASSACPALPTRLGPSSSYGVYLYTDTNYQGQCSFFSYTSSGDGDARTWLIGDNTASSMRVVFYRTTGTGNVIAVDAVLYDGFNRTGASIPGGNIPDLNTVGFNDRVSSLKIVREIK